MKSKTRRIALCAMLAAMFECLSLISINLGSMKITLDFLPIIIAAMLFGPVEGAIVGLAGSFLNQLLSYGLTPTTVLWILPAGVRGLLVGFYAKKHSFSLNREQTVFILILSALVVTALNTGVMYLDSVIIGYPFAATAITVVLRVVNGILTAILFTFILPTVIERLRKFAKDN